MKLYGICDNSFPMFVKNRIEIFMVIVFNKYVVVDTGVAFIFTESILPINEQRRFVHLLASSLISFFFLFSWYVFSTFITSFI